MPDVEANKERSKNQWHDRSQRLNDEMVCMELVASMIEQNTIVIHDIETRSLTHKHLLFANDLTLNFHNIWLLFYVQCATDLWRLHKRWIVRKGTMKKTLPGFKTASARTTIHGYLNTSGHVIQCLGFFSMTAAAVMGFLCTSTKPPGCTSFSTPCSSLVTVPTAMVLKSERKDWTWKEKRMHTSHLYTHPPPTSLQI